MGIKQTTKTFCLTIIFLSGFFIFPKIAEADDNDIVINEIGAYESSANEWIEIFNKGTAPVDLTGWKFYEDTTNHRLTSFLGDFIIEAGEYAIIANVAENFKASHIDFTGTILDSSWSSLKESGEEIGLKNSLGEMIENFTYLSCPNTSLQRVDANTKDYSALNWQPHQSANSAGKLNEFPQQNNNDGNDNNDDNGQDTDGGQDGTDSGDGGNTDNPPPLSDTTKPAEKIISSGTIVINEFVSDPADGEVEWIELYNKNPFDIDLGGWKIIDGAGSETSIVGVLGSNYDTKFFVIENPKGKLNNTGDAIILKDPAKNIIDAVYYGNWDSGFIDQNAPVAKDPNSVARIFDGANTYNNKNDFAITETPTKGGPNSIALPEEEKKALQALTDTQNEKNKEIEKNIIINEIYPNPIGSDLEDEFIELKNIGTEPVDIIGWKIKDNSKKVYKIISKDFSATIISPGEYFVIERRISKLALNNDKDTFKLVNADDKTIQTIKYSEEENVPENASLVPDENNDWLWTTTPTKGQENILTKLNHAPEIYLDCPKTALINEEIVCDASDSFDLDGDNLNFIWEVNKQKITESMTKLTFSKLGTYIINLTISDGVAETKETQKIKISEPKVEEDKIIEPKTTKVKASSTKKATSKKTLSNINQASILEIDGNDQQNQVLKYLITSAIFLGLGLVAVIKKKKKAPSDIT